MRERAFWRNPLGGQFNQGQSGLGIIAPPQMHGQFGERNLQRRPDPAAEKVAAVGRAICLAHDYVRMESGLAVLLHDISCKGQDFNLFFDRNLFIFLLQRIKESESQLAERANAHQVCIRETVGIGKFEKTFPDFVAFVEDDCECLQAPFSSWSSFDFILSFSLQAAQPARLCSASLPLLSALITDTSTLRPAFSASR